MNPEYKVEVKNVTKEYDLYKTKSDQLKNFFSLGKVDVPHFWSLKGVSLSIKAGETLGIIGINGSGKSTLSNIISGIIPQTTGSVEVRGDTSIIAIGAGLKRNLTGAENIRLKGLMQGLSIQEIEDLKSSIIDFADIGNFIDQPVKDYSTGMRSRLGFAIAVHINPDIIIIDEALSVGDDTFYQKCVNKIIEFKKQGKTIIFVSHSLGQVEKICDRVAWMHYGDLREIGDTKEIVDHYRTFSKDFKKKSSAERREYQAKKKQEQADFDIEEYKRTLIEQTSENEQVNRAKAEKIVNKAMYGQILPEKMTTSTKAVLWCAILLMAFFCLVNISGHSITNSVQHPTTLLHPTHRVITKG
ncbi:ABC transporter ATP-binding protein [Pediococcus acidilactici]|uniref:ABC transporter ATP-binding protein n=1 Tax=Pediococcus acidilactici TaxID=1254 RepID=UPI0013298758|nr:ABC transporter ATP-binding protein [Pediococcus acidilactici]KAF0336653.1 ATP-binding cassette domain-containing protein [Pediococcus acidilactici]KAF0337314.1 ATP-binding cassette domain-containing protein [Pediococcus acidilactici]KAF0340055.1 ATP-binding cassette domain-containing protein [Pediococcus acidilactici]KAF0345484.1 ATP-binding cassette domain-containing protein [Pediococcus acidilactici]KAF0349191.1 ATP-binding cassette domain-containing protein [Pediococcus acidilactici]